MSVLKAPGQAERWIRRFGSDISNAEKDFALLILKNKSVVPRLNKAFVAVNVTLALVSIQSTMANGKKTPFRYGKYGRWLEHANCSAR